MADAAASTVKRIRSELRALGNLEKARFLQRFFKTGPGEYAEGDVLLGVTVPQIRRLARKWKDLPLRGIQQLLKSEFHEERLLALLLLVDRFGRADPAEQEKIYDFYLSHTRYINNWDLVDSSARLIIGPWLLQRNKSILRKLARSKDLWERRIAITATYHFITKNEFSETLALAKILLHDKEDLIHKAVGWMLREVGKRDPSAEEAFLLEHYSRMPRTMLRYAIERFPESRRRMYLQGKL